MGARSRRPVFSACLATAILAVLPCATASAEWAEDNSCGYLPGTIFPLPLTAFEPEAQWAPPEGRFTYNSPSDKVPPLKDLSASATWGDGTSTPVAVEQPVSNCFAVHAPAHSYAHPGVYEFSYAVHDSSTGGSHQLRAQQMRIWNPVPQPLWTSRPHIYPTVGNAWKGVVGEFSAESPWNASFYAAQVQAEPGAVQPAAIAGGHERLVVTASLTYSHPFNGTVSVLLSRLVGSRPLGSWATATVTARPPAHIGIHGRPALVAIPGGRSELLLRLSRPLVRPRSGRPAAWVYAAGQTASLFHYGRRHGNRCYAGVLGAAALDAALVRGSLPFTLAIRGRQISQREGLAQRSAASAAAAGRALGC